MKNYNVFMDYGLLTIISLIILSFLAGFIDSVVGGGGLIQLPALLINFPQSTLASLFGTNKIAALFGTSLAAIQYSKKVNFNYGLLLIVSIFAGTSSFFGAKLISYANPEKLKPIILAVLIFIAIYTFLKKDLGTSVNLPISLKKQITYGTFFAILIGFYDGFIGPGTGSFLVLTFVLFLKFNFLQASAYSKVVNCVTNLSALFVFIKNRNYILEIAILMSIFNVLGSFVGTKMAINRGNVFIKSIFLISVMMLIFKYSYDIFIK